MSRWYCAADVGGALQALGVTEGGTILVHSALFALGPMGGVDEPAEIPERVYEAVRAVVGASGTIVVPASFDDYARFGTPYDCRRSPVDAAQGVFSAYVAARPEAVRTFCPMSGLAAVGPLAEDICHRRTGAAFGTHSAWERLYEHDAMAVFLGIRPARAFTFVLYIQSRFGVPYLYNKLYSAPVFEDGRPVTLPITSAVRFLNPAFKVRENCVPYEEHLTAAGLVATAPLGRGRAFAVPSLRKAFDEGTRRLQDDLYYFLAAPPAFIPGEIPTDGPTGAFVPDALRFSEGTQS